MLQWIPICQLIHFADDRYIFWVCSTLLWQHVKLKVDSLKRRSQTLNNFKCLLSAIKQNKTKKYQTAKVKFYWFLFQNNFLCNNTICQCRRHGHEWFVIWEVSDRCGSAVQWERGSLCWGPGGSVCVWWLKPPCSPLVAPTEQPEKQKHFFRYSLGLLIYK